MEEVKVDLEAWVTRCDMHCQHQGALVSWQNTDRKLWTAAIDQGENLSRVWENSWCQIKL